MDNFAARKDDNMQNLLLDALMNKGRVESYPALVAITALEKCNYRCVMCTHQNHASKDQISAAALAQIEPVLPYVQEVCITGGEPFLYDHIEDFFRICHAGQCAPMVQTNGSLLRERQSRMLLKSGVAVLKVSVDGATPETYNRIRRGGDFMNIFRNLMRLKELKTARGRRLPLVEFNFVAMRSNIEELVKLTLLASKVGVVAINVFLLLAENEDMARESLYFFPDLADREFMRAVNAGVQFGVEVRTPPLFSEKPQFGQQVATSRRCVEPWRALTVNVNGSAAICCGGAGQAGNLNTESFDEVWNHPRRVLVRETVNTADELPCCRNCRQGRPVTDGISSHIPNPELAQQTLAYFGKSAEVQPGL